MIVSCDGHSDDGSQEEGSEQEDSKGLYDRSHQDWGKYWWQPISSINKNSLFEILGVTSLVVSPLFEQVSDLQFSRAPMHGYGTRDFKRLNPRLSKAGESTRLVESPTLKRLVDACHGAGIESRSRWPFCNHSSPEINGK